MGKIELKDIAAYLPYGLKVIYEEHFGLNDYEIKDINAVNVCSGTIEILCNHSYIWTDKYKTILVPLSDLTKEINGKIGLTELLKLNSFNTDLMSWEEQLEYLDIFTKKDLINLADALWMFEHHFDIYGLIDKRLAVDINTLK